MTKITYKRNGEEVTKEFENYEDLIEAVILLNIKDEELVSITFGDEEITGGIFGLALYALRHINQVREARKNIEDVLESEEYEEDYDEDEEYDEFDDEDDDYDDDDYDDDYDDEDDDYLEEEE